jgi:hypothetical protein
MECRFMPKKFDLAQLADGCRVSRFVTKRLRALKGRIQGLYALGQ